MGDGAFGAFSGDGSAESVGYPGRTKCMHEPLLEDIESARKIQIERGLVELVRLNLDEPLKRLVKWSRPARCRAMNVDLL